MLLSSTNNKPVDDVVSGKAAQLDRALVLRTGNAAKRRELGTALAALVEAGGGQEAATGFAALGELTDGRRWAEHDLQRCAELGRAVSIAAGLRDELRLRTWPAGPPDPALVPRIEELAHRVHRTRWRWLRNRRDRKFRAFAGTADAETGAVQVLTWLAAERETDRSRRALREFLGNRPADLPAHFGEIDRQWREASEKQLRELIRVGVTGGSGVLRRLSTALTDEEPRLDLMVEALGFTKGWTTSTLPLHRGGARPGGDRRGKPVQPRTGAPARLPGEAPGRRRRPAAAAAGGDRRSRAAAPARRAGRGPPAGTGREEPHLRRGLRVQRVRGPVPAGTPAARRALPVPPGHHPAAARPGRAQPRGGRDRAHFQGGERDTILFSTVVSDGARRLAGEPAQPRQRRGEPGEARARGVRHPPGAAGARTGHPARAGRNGPARADGRRGTAEGYPVAIAVTGRSGTRIDLEVSELPDGDPRGGLQRAFAVRDANPRALGWQVLRVPDWQVGVELDQVVDTAARA